MSTSHERSISRWNVFYEKLGVEVVGQASVTPGPYNEVAAFYRLCSFENPSMWMVYSTDWPDFLLSIKQARLFFSTAYVSSLRPMLCQKNTSMTICTVPTRSLEDHG